MAHDRIQAHPRLSLTVDGRLIGHLRYGTAFVPRTRLPFRAALAIASLVGTEIPRARPWATLHPLPGPGAFLPSHRQSKS